MKKRKNRIIIVTGCFIDCPFKKENSGMGHCAPFITCEKRKMVLEDQDDYKKGQWRREGKVIHPDCPLEKK